MGKVFEFQQYFTLCGLTFPNTIELDGTPYNFTVLTNYQISVTVKIGVLVRRGHVRSQSRVRKPQIKITCRGWSQNHKVGLQTIVPNWDDKILGTQDHIAGCQGPVSANNDF